MDVRGVVVWGGKLKETIIQQCGQSQVIYSRNPGFMMEQVAQDRVCVEITNERRTQLGQGFDSPC